MAAKYLLKLFISGMTPKSEQAIANLGKICEKDLACEYDLEVIDVLEHPELAEEEKIMVTPTLIKKLPPPIRRIIGDLTDTEKVLVGLELKNLP